MSHQKQLIGKLTVNPQTFPNKNAAADYKSGELSKAMTDLIKPEEDGAQLPYELTPHKKKKERIETKLKKCYGKR